MLLHTMMLADLSMVDDIFITKDAWNGTPDPDSNGLDELLLLPLHNGPSGKKP
mgnify:CR=1 FL=1